MYLYLVAFPPDRLTVRFIGERVGTEGLAAATKILQTG
jgi:hypothetical protein